MSRLRANQITNENANGAPNFPHGITVTGIVTASTASTTMDQIVVGSAVTSNSNGVDTVGIVTAGTFKNKAGGTFAPNPTTTQGDIIVRGASANERLAIGAAGKVLKVNSSANGLEYGAGSPVLQCKVSYNSSTVAVTHSGTADTNLFGLTGNRVYGDLNTITITPVSATSTMIIQGLSGMTDPSGGYYNSTGAFGIVAILNNSSLGAIDNTDYQYYPESSTLGNNFYPPNVAVQGSYASGNTSAQTWRMKGYTYRESGTNRSRFAKSHLIIWEVEI